jgi:hypothetical protein
LAIAFEYAVFRDLFIVGDNDRRAIRRSRDSLAAVGRYVGGNINVVCP